MSLFKAGGGSENPTQPADIAVLIVEASYACAEPFRPFIEDTCDQTKVPEKFEHIASEFLFAFLHMLDRTMMAEHGARFRDEHVDAIAALTITEKARRQYPGVNAETFGTCVTLLGLDANDAHAAYANCSEILVTAKPFTGNGIVNKLARFVCRDLNSPHNPELHRQAISTFGQFSAALALRKLVATL